MTETEFPSGIPDIGGIGTVCDAIVTWMDCDDSFSLGSFTGIVDTRGWNVHSGGVGEVVWYTDIGGTFCGCGDDVADVGGIIIITECYLARCSLRGVIITSPGGFGDGRTNVCGNYGATVWIRTLPGSATYCISMI